MKLFELFGFGQKRSVVLPRGAQEELQRLLDSVISSGEQAIEAIHIGHAEKFLKQYTNMTQTMHYIEEMLRGRGPKEFKQ